jgi:hypothetical protein
MRKLLLSVVVASLLAACAEGAAGDGGGTPTGDSGISGIVTLGPTCPVQREDSPCPDKAYQATLRVVDANGDVVATVKTAEDGTFRVAVPPGTYTVDAGPPHSGGFPVAHPVEVTVEAHGFTEVTVQFDTGIRIPQG